MKSIEFEVGELGEGSSWRIELDSQLLNNGDSKPCPHAHSFRIDTSYGTKEKPYGFWTIPASIVCSNEGGYNSTVLCLECLKVALGDSTRNCLNDDSFCHDCLAKAST